MNALLKTFAILTAVPLLSSGCGALAVQTRQEEPTAPKLAVYESILGKPLTDHMVADFVSVNNCSRADQYLLCNAIGIALWTDVNQVVETVYLYLNNLDGFEPYKGALPYGLRFYDTMGAVEYKLKRQGVGNAGRPDVGAVPDRMHYRAIYYQVGMTILYNEPFADEDATIYAILVSKLSESVEAKS